MKFNKTHFFSMLLALASCFYACKKDELVAGFQGEAKLFLEVPENREDVNNALYVNSDSAHYRFAHKPADVLEDTIMVLVRLMGSPINADRSVKLMIDAEGSTAQPSEYVLPDELVLPAGARNLKVPLRIKRAERLRNTEVGLKIKLMPTADFKINPESWQKLQEYTVFRIYWSDILNKPAWWIGFHVNIGKYSREKHRFILDAWDVSVTRFDQAYIYNENGARLINDTNLVYMLNFGRYGLEAQLKVYNINNPEHPLRNDSGEEIGFCTTCN